MFVESSMVIGYIKCPQELRNKLQKEKATLSLPAL
jgi:hypothetical protein